MDYISFFFAGIVIFSWKLDIVSNTMQYFGIMLYFLEYMLLYALNLPGLIAAKFVSVVVCTC